MLTQSVIGSCSQSPGLSRQDRPAVHSKSVRKCHQPLRATGANTGTASHASTACPSNPGNHQYPQHSPLQHQPKSSRRVSLLAAASGLLLNARTMGAQAEEAQQSTSSGPFMVAAESPGPGPGVGPLPPLADRPGASGKQLLQDPNEFTYAFESEVPCDLRVKQYYEIIVKNRPKCWQRIASQIQTSNFTGLDEGLKKDAMADLRQAALFTPWALLQRDDYTASVEVRKGYLSLNAHIQDLQIAALGAAENGENQQKAAERVQQAFILMSASLDDFLSRIPNKYKDGPQGA
ncbi:hypothetical protein DUNSADRAFT_11131 [Dunaliella salina]|uniref:Uncharacterized protein n=1 Tax=Dunaliella salina TaxID=3046 RepID=A0ABQ7H4M8_DUNSA|nr:hypothetical protein DUNSADRAFT_11131 [Dunaliella salina]|eukprot:KAF5841815.1 hypothetical protein DUNSADRAFT_11131 [Dunaliella salina]